jgi:deoxyribodipyrimidine photo-lyase
MIAYRRISWNFALDRAVEWTEKLRKPLLILEALRCDYKWASDRLHTFVIEGMAENAGKIARAGALYYPYVEPRRGAGKGLLSALSSKACVVVTDEFPCFFLPAMVTSAARQVSVLMEVVDSNGLLPLRRPQQAYPTAFSFRRFLQKELPSHLSELPKSNPLPGRRFEPITLPREITERWPRVKLDREENPTSKIPFDQRVSAVQIRGGSTAAQTLLRRFLRDKLAEYSEVRNEPEERGTSELSPYLHFGHISVHQIFAELAKQEKWTPARLALRATGSRAGWWGVGRSAEAFLDQIVTWRELGFNFCQMRKDYDRFDSLPDWALKTLALHARDERAEIYNLAQFERATTHDALWNAAQMQLVREGTIHNYLRMLWGKKILEWSRTPEAALKIMLELNNKYGIDGRDPNSYSGIFWCLGRYDRPWGPERPIFGKVRYMTSQNTARKFRLKDYIRKYAGDNKIG